MFRETTRCLLCGNDDLVALLSLGDQVLTGVFPKDPGATITRGPLELLKCREQDDGSTCGLVQLAHIYDLDEMYGDNYGYRSSLNASMACHLGQLVASVERLVDLSPGDLVIDIGSNDGTLLRAYPDTLVRAGIDPTAEKFRQYYPTDVHVIPDFFSTAAVRQHFGNEKAKVVTSISMFYDLESPLVFAQQVSDCLADDGVWVMEQSYLPLMLERLAYDTVCHEHLEYYRLHQIEWLAERSDLKIVDVEVNDVNGGSFRVTLAKKGSHYQPNRVHIANLLESETRSELNTIRPYSAFAVAVEQHRDQLNAALANVRNRGDRVFGYGASTKGNVLLQYCGISASEVSCIAEVNQEKFGCFTPGTNIPIISEAEAHQANPECYLVLPWHFHDSIIEREQEYLSRGGSFLMPLPSIQIINQETPRRRAIAA